MLRNYVGTSTYPRAWTLPLRGIRYVPACACFPDPLVSIGDRRANMQFTAYMTNSTHRLVPT